MRRFPFAAPVLAALLAGCAPTLRTPPAPVSQTAATASTTRHPLPAIRYPRTRAERSNYTETSSYTDVIAFLDSLQALDAPMYRGEIGTTTEGRALPFVVASRPLVTTPEEARRLGRPIVYVQGNIHGGEVEGKEAMLAMLRDLLFRPRPNALDSLVLVVVPIYNADGNDAWGPQARNRSEQNGPERIGRRTNAQGYDLNRDYMKAEAPETRASLRMFNLWNPDVFVDLHTTDGSYHGYALTYSPSLTPASGEAGVFTRDEILPELRRRMREREGFEVFDYGNFSRGYALDTDTIKEGWFSYEHLPRYGTNYYGVRGKISVLSEAFSHDPLERRVKSTYAFVRQLLGLVEERSGEILAMTRDGQPAAGTQVAIRSELTHHPYTGPVIAEDLAKVDSGVVTQPGVPAGLKRTGHYRTLQIPVYDRFDPVLTVTAPEAYLLGPELSGAVRLLRLHGIDVEELSAPRAVRGEAFTIDSVVTARRPFQGHLLTSLEGRWHPVTRTAPVGSFLVSTTQPLGTLAVYLLEPQSDDGLVMWSRPTGDEPWQDHFFDDMLRPGADFPVIRVDQPEATEREARRLAEH